VDNAKGKNKYWLEVTFRQAVPILCRYGYVTFVSDSGHFPSRDVFGPTYKYFILLVSDDEGAHEA
jgi:hypothetical protein